MHNITIVNFIFIILPTTKRVEASMLLVWRIRASNEPSRRLMFYSIKEKAPTTYMGNKSNSQGFVCVAGLYVGQLFPRQVVLWSVIG